MILDIIFAIFYCIVFYYTVSVKCKILNKIITIMILIASWNIMGNKCCVVECCSNYDGKPQFLLWMRFFNRKDLKSSFTSFFACNNQFEEKF